MKSKPSPRKLDSRRLQRQPAAPKGAAVDGNRVLVAVVTLMLCLLAGVLLLTILERPEAEKGWALVQQTFQQGITALLAILGVRYSLSKRA